MTGRNFLQSLSWGLLGLVLLALPVLYIRENAASAKSSKSGSNHYFPIPDFTLTNQHGAEIKLDHLKGKYWVADIIFTHCPVQCLKMTQNMASLQKALQADPEVQLISLTADPESDQPAVLHEYASRFKADQSQWWFLTGPKKAINEFAVNGLKLSLVESDEKPSTNPEDWFVHSAKFVVVDKSGTIRAWLDGDQPEVVEQTVQLLKKLRKE
jgi:protein SCO1/2